MFSRVIYLVLFVHNTVSSQQTQNICITFVQCQPNVFDVNPTLYKWYTHVLCLPGCGPTRYVLDLSVNVD